MKITLLLVKRLVELGLDAKHLDVASRDVGIVRAFVLEKMTTGALSYDVYTSLVSQEDESAAAALVAKQIAVANSGNQAQFDLMNKSMAGMMDAISKLASASVVAPAAAKAAPTTDIGAAAVLFGSTAPVTGVAPVVDARVKCVSELFSKSCEVMTYAKHASPKVAAKLHGTVMSPMGDGYREMTTESELDRAVSHSWFKHLVSRRMKADGKAVPRGFKLNDQDIAVVNYAVHNSRFLGPLDHASEEAEGGTWMNGQKLNSDIQRKGLLDDTASGGLEAVPIEFDNAIIKQAILTGELLPYVNVVTVARRRIEGTSIGNVTFGNTAEGTALTPFTTTAFIAAFDTTIYPITGSMEMGLDFLSDSPLGMTAAVSERYSTGYANELDRLLAEGTGTNQMLGLNNTVGMTTVTSVGGGAGPIEVSDWEGMLFGVGKAYRQEAGQKAVFLSNDTTYRRTRSIPVGTTDARRVYGMDHESYMTHNHPHRISETTLNSVAGFYCLNRYRCYRRQGYSLRIEQGGKDLAMRNMQLIILRARFGGQMELGAAGARSTNMMN